MDVFSVEGLRVTVVGAARSGVAEAELLVRRGARVTLTEQADTVAEAQRLSAAGVALEAGGHRRETLVDADLVVLSPGVPLAERTRDRDHGHQGQVDDDHADWSDARRLRRAGAGWREHRGAAIRAG